ncbi:FixH family protein [Marinospirillum perlucidum]|uniref:FixH family protein n=1 Tax=Marinospirillum perlucidum TaxID=1982602 RepID=UPI000DF3B12E|nr:FixH family protein [Marinospirillum perlucidum]
MATLEKKSRKPWYKEPFAWLAFFPVTLGVFFGLSLLVIGNINYDGVVDENYYKEGLAINQSFERDRFAEELNLTASLRFVQDQLHMDLQGQLPEYPEELLVHMENPTRASKDFTIAMKHLQGGRYLGTLTQQPDNDWDVKLYGPDREWRLSSRASFPLQAPLEMAPSLH